MREALPVSVLIALLFAGCAEEASGLDASPTPTIAPEPTVDAETGSVTGTVVDEEQKPIKKAEISVVDAGDAVTDDSGAFTINGILPGEQKILVAALGYEPQAKKITVEAGQVAQIQFVLVAIVIEEGFHETFSKVGSVSGQWTVNYVVNVVNHTTLDNVFCGPCIWEVVFPPNIKDAVTDVMFTRSASVPYVNEFILMAYNKAGQGQTYSGLASAEFTEGGDTHHWTEGQVKSLKGVPKARLQLSGGDAEDVGVAFQQKVELWQTWAFGLPLPEDFTVLPPK